MPIYPTPPNLGKLLAAHERRIRTLELQIGNRVQIGAPGTGAAYDANVISNGGIESGATGWITRWPFGTVGHFTVDISNPITGVRSLIVNEAANSWSRVYWCPGNPLAPTVGTDVWATSPGDQWLLSVSLRCPTGLDTAYLNASCGTTAADVFDSGGNQDWVTAASAPVPADSVTALSGLITVPTGRNFIGFQITPTTTATPPSSAWTWEFDLAALQQKLS